MSDRKLFAESGRENKNPATRAELQENFTLLDAV
jgi:hypothetical protein